MDGSPSSAGDEAGGTPGAPGARPDGADVALQQEGTPSWAPGALPPEQADAVAVLADLSLHRPARPTAPPASPGFSPDGSAWWDGTRWTPTTALERTGSGDAEGGAARASRRLVRSGVAVAVLVVLGLLAAPLLWTARGGASDETLQMALLDVAEAQQQHLMDHGRFASDETTLSVYLVRLGGLPDDVTVEVRASDELTYCVAATSADGDRLWISESGTVSTRTCG